LPTTPHCHLTPPHPHLPLPCLQDSRRASCAARLNVFAPARSSALRGVQLVLSSIAIASFTRGVGCNLARHVVAYVSCNHGTAGHRRRAFDGASRGSASSSGGIVGVVPAVNKHGAAWRGGVAATRLNLAAALRNNQSAAALILRPSFRARAVAPRLLVRAARCRRTIVARCAWRAACRCARIRAQARHRRCCRRCRATHSTPAHAARRARTWLLSYLDLARNPLPGRGVIHLRRRITARTSRCALFLHLPLFFAFKVDAL